ncbi:zinc finger protein 37-like [Anopheles ziemanni]|uniref:zinc finger protein 37-like n=1 Tax=Anopheles coustani TaxID=139045 RepID=UPI00265972C6|nr:zinc finger protein 37-like [Anopheles coustani]XP_058171567.1 zinc finger protein 37-like [Anopheles ziemanni]
MVESESCALCLTTQSKWFLEVFCEDSQSKDIAVIISKHLWFDLKPTKQTYVCADCWKSVHDFHLFYTKLERIHHLEEEITEPPTNNAKTNSEPHEDFEFHPVETIKLEPLEHDYGDETAQPKQEEHTNETVQNESETDRKKERPRRSNVATVKYKSESSDNEWDVGGKDLLSLDLEDDDVDDDDFMDDEDDEDDDDFINYDAINDNKEQVVVKEEQKTNDDTKVPHAAGDTGTPDVPVKRGRGRPPKRKLDEHGARQPSASYGASLKVRKRRARKRMDSISSSDSELDDGSDFERKEWKKLRAKSKKDRGKPLGSRQMRDKRIFSYVDEFFCYYCPEKVLFERFHHANQHYKRVHDEPAFLRCPKCGKKCFTPGGFVSHMETHDDPEKNKCKICGKVTDQKITLKKHMRAHQVKLEENLPYACSQCPRRFEQEKKRDKHERLHGRKIVIKKEKGRDLELLAFYKRIYCEVCEEAKPESTSFDNFWDLKVHMGNEHNKTPYLKCPICFKKNACRQQLMVHVDVHNNPEHYRCEVCKEIHQNLEKHMIKAHSPETTIPDEKNYSCEHCGKMFKFKTNLRSHIDRVHGVKDVCCNICNKYFNHKALSAHKRSAHTDEMFMCEHCPKMFKTRSGLESHKGDHDENQRKSVKCTLCGKEMRRGASMAKHMKTIHSQEDPVNCNLCGKVFRTSFHMMRHRANTCAATISSRPYKCEVCGKGFAMKLTMTEHMTTHTRTSLYQCAFCFKTFGYISNLYKHRKKAHPLEWQEVQARPDQGIATVIEMRN